MTEKRIYSTLFPLESQRLTKEKQELHIGEVLAKGYEQLTGTALTRVRRPPQGADPPDLLCEWRGIKVGVELFELEQFYGARALLGNLTNRIYKEFQSRHLSSRYQGMVISLGVLAGLVTSEEIKAKWTAAGIKTGTSQAAKELVDLVASRVPSRDSLPKTDFGLVIPVDSTVYPALAGVTSVVNCARCRIDDPRRTDKRASPLVIASPGYTYNDPEIVKSVADHLGRKVQRKANSPLGWKSVDHSVLVAHDHPRWRTYELFGMKWESYLRLAAEQARVLDFYDELWLVIVRRKLLEWEAVQISGTVLSAHA